MITNKQKKMRKRQELCSETQASAYNMLNQCLQLPQKYYPSLFEQQSPRILLLCRTRFTVRTANVLRASSFYEKNVYFILHCDAATQRDLFFCIAHAFGKDFAHFLDACLD